MRKSLYGTGLTALATVIVLLLTAVFSRSDALAVTWVIAKCDRGEIAQAYYEQADGGTVVVGSAAACLLTVTDSEFGIAVFQAGAKTVTVLSTRMREVSLVDNLKCTLADLGLGQCAFKIMISKTPGTFGLCLTTGPDKPDATGKKGKRLGCAKLVFRTTPSLYVELSQIATTDALVNAEITSKQVAVDPRCGSCW